jgi:hypothetical protein
VPSVYRTLPYGSSRLTEYTILYVGLTIIHVVTAYTPAVTPALCCASVVSILLQCTAVVLLPTERLLLLPTVVLPAAGHVVLYVPCAPPASRHHRHCPGQAAGGVPAVVCHTRRSSSSRGTRTVTSRAVTQGAAKPWGTQWTSAKPWGQRRFCPEP